MLNRLLAIISGGALSLNKNNLLTRALEQWSANTWPRPGAGLQEVRYRAAYFSRPKALHPISETNIFLDMTIYELHFILLLWNLRPHCFRTFCQIRLLLDFYTLGALRLTVIRCLKVFSHVVFEWCLFKRYCIL